MMKDVVISLHSTQNTGTDEEDTIDFSTDFRLIIIKQRNDI